MPKVHLTEKDRLCTRLSRYVYGEMKERGLRQETVAKEMGISQATLSYKLRKSSFSYSDFVFFVKMFKPDEKELLYIIGL